MEYLLWTVVALAAFSVVPPLVSDITQDVPATPGLFLSTAIFLVIASSVLLATGTAEASYLVTPAAGYIYVAGVFLVVGILAYTVALETGPVSVVVPIYGMFIVGSSAIAVVFLNESLTATRAAGMVCAVLAIYLTAGGEQ